MAKQPEELIVNSLIGEESEFVGEIKVKGLLRIDGYFKGKIITQGKILIGEKGIVDTDIRAAIVVVGGEVRGSIIATKKVTLLATSKVYGDIITKKIVAEEGVIFEGRCKINQS